MKITESKGFSSPNLPARPQIKHHTSRLAFNFSFLTNATQYNLKKNNKNVNNKIRIKLLEKIATLSEEDKVLILNRPKDQGLELLPEEQVKLRINQEFKDSGRYEECDDCPIWNRAHPVCELNDDETCDNADEAEDDDKFDPYEDNIVHCGDHCEGCLLYKIHHPETEEQNP